MKYALVGDSHAQAVFPKLKNIFEQLGHRVVVSKPKAGWTLKKHLNDGLGYLLQQTQPDVLILSLGGNNSNLSSSYQYDINEVLRHAKNAGVSKVFWVSPAWALRSDVQQRHEWTTNYLKSNLPKRVRLIDIRPLTKTGHRSDGVHFDSATYDRWANHVVNEVLKLNAITLIPKWTWLLPISLATIILVFRRGK